ncbi:MAG TPA: hypothetical protein VGJ20_24030 [Xanthobacteraceae bacterium]
MSKLGLLILTSAVLIPPIQAESQDAATIADVRCALAGMQIYGSTDSTQQASGVWLSLYYIGRIQGRAPQLDLEGLFVGEASKMKSSDYASEAKRCSIGLSATAEQITHIGRDLLQAQKRPPAR